MIVRRLGATVGLAGLLGAPLYLIGRVVGNPILTGVQWDTLRRTGTLDSPTALKLGAGLFYLVWFWLVAIALSEIARVRQAQPEMTSTRMWSPANLVRRLVRLALATTVTTAAIPVLAFLPRSAPAAAVMAPPRSTAMRRTESSERVWEASGRDTALSVSIDVFDTEARREDIVRLNRGRTSPEGVDWQSGPFPKGMRILLPTDAPVLDVAVPLAVEIVTIQSGDNLWTLAKGRLDVADGPASQPTDVEIAGYTDSVIADNHEVFVEKGNADLVLPGQEFAFPALGNGAEVPMPPTVTQPSPMPVPLLVTMPAHEPLVPATSPATTVQRTNGSSSPTQSPHPSPLIAQTSNTSLPRPIATAAMPLPPPTTSPALPTVAVSSAAANSIPSAHENGHSSVPPLAERVGWLGSATLAAGLLAVGARRSRSRSGRLRRPSEATRDMDLALRSTPLIDSATWAAETLRAMPLPTTRPGCAAAVLEAVQLGEHGLEVLWKQPQPDVPEGWTSVNGGWSWERTRTSAPGTAIGLAAYPSLVTIGRRDGDDVLLNLEAAGIIEITGPAATDVARAIVLELGATPHGDVNVTLTNATEIDGIEHIAGVRSAPVDEIIHWLDHHRTTFADHLTAAGHESLPHLRANSGDTFEPAVAIVDATELADPDLDRLLVAAGPGAIILLINPSTPSGRGWQLECTTEQTIVQPLGVTVAPTPVSATTAESITIMLAEVGGGPANATVVSQEQEAHEASSLVVADPESILSGRYGIDPDLVTRNTDLDAVDLVEGEIDVEREPVGIIEPWAIQFRVLGSVKCVTELAEPLQPKELEVAIFIALHRDGKTSDTIRTMVWPDQIADQRWHNLTTRIRQKLGMTGEGRPRLPKPGADLRYGLHDSVVTDWDLFLGYARAAEHVAAAEALEHYRAAFELISGPPFSDVPTGYSWAFSDGTVTEMMTTLAAVAQQAAQLALDLEDPELALRLIRYAHRAIDPVEAQLLVALEIQACMATGRTEAATLAYDQLLQSLDGDDPMPCVLRVKPR